MQHLKYVNLGNANCSFVSHQAKDEYIAMEEKYRNELSAHVKLSSLYKVRTTAWNMEKITRLKKDVLCIF